MEYSCDLRLANNNNNNFNNNNNNNMYLKSSIQTSSINYKKSIHITLKMSSNIPIQYTKHIITNNDIYTSK